MNILYIYSIKWIKIIRYGFYDYLHLFQVKNQFNFIVLSIIVSDFFISSIGVTLDIIGAILQGSTLANWLCYFEGPFHTSFGNILIYIYNIYYLLWKKLSNGILMDDKTILNHRAGIFIQYFIISRSKNDCNQKWW